MAGRLGAGINLPGEQRLDLRSETQGPAIVGDVERLDAERAAGEKHLPLARIPDGETKHAAQHVHHRRPLLRIQLEQHLGIGMRAGDDAVAVQLLAQLHMIVDFAVENDPVAGFRVVHRLRPCRAEIDDRQAPVCQPHALVVGNPQPRAIRPARDHALAYAHQLRLIYRRGVWMIRIKFRQCRTYKIP